MNGKMLALASNLRQRERYDFPAGMTTTPTHVRDSSSGSGYVLLDAGGGERLEQWGPYRLRRPDPRATGVRARPTVEWDRVDARFHGEAGRGRWERIGGVPERWTIDHGGLTLIVKLAPFKHTGVFPEQAEHWRWMTRAAAADADAGAAADAGGAAGASGAGTPPLEILNLFAYTGGATVALAKAGHKVTHVDASKPALAWARENAAANGLPADAVRWIQDDAATFVRREIKRGRTYDAALMDPPAFGHTPRGGIWRVDDQLEPLVADVLSLLPDAVFFLINHYAREADGHELARVVTPHLPSSLRAANGARAEHGVLRLKTASGRSLDTGVYARWRSDRQR
jgi:23S rRNA (cytosine1962-C5)-methyltransferase